MVRIDVIDLLQISVFTKATAWPCFKGSIDSNTRYYLGYSISNHQIFKTDLTHPIKNA